MEVEVKFRLDKENFEKTVSLLHQNSKFIKTDNQKNFFFDSKRRELDQKRINFRIRIINETTAIITIKGKGDKGGKLTNGISRISEVEQDLDLLLANKIISNPLEILNHGNIPLIKVFLDELESKDVEISEQFSNTRFIFDYKGYKLEVDETEYTFGKAFEIEIESEKPEEAKKVVEAFLTENGIHYSFSKRSKYGNLKAGAIL